MQDDYSRRVSSAERAVEAVRSGDRVWVHEGCATPEILVKALLKRAHELRNVEINHMLTLGSADYTRPEYEGHFRHSGLFLGAASGWSFPAGRKQSSRD
jgi:4-hydroxybutyrate CoA-transferase